MKITESQLRNIIANTLNEMMDEGRPRIKPSYWEIEDYTKVPGVELYVYNPLKCKNPQYRDPERLKQALLYYHALYAYVDEEGCVHAYFYHVGSNFIEGPDAWGEETWYELLGEPTMKGIAKQIPVLLYEKVPNFKEEWNKQLSYKDEDKPEYGKGEAATIYNTVPTIHGSGGMVDESKLKEIIRETLNGMINTKK